MPTLGFILRSGAAIALFILPTGCGDPSKEGSTDTESSTDSQSASAESTAGSGGETGHGSGGDGSGGADVTSGDASTSNDGSVSGDASTSNDGSTSGNESSTSGHGSSDSAGGTDTGGQSSDATSSGSAGTTSGGELTCDQNGPDCEVCQEEKCCDLLMYCGMSSDCTCLAQCVGQSGLGDVDSCMSACALDSSPTGWDPLEECMTLSCPDGDECSAP